MKATELRIGNYVDTIYGVQKVIGIDDSDEIGAYVIFNDGRKFGHYIEHNGEVLVKPIPFDHDWMSKLELDNLVGQNFRDVWSFYIGESNPTEIKFRYVHEAQNIHYAVYGEELTINQ